MEPPVHQTPRRRRIALLAIAMLAIPLLVAASASAGYLEDQLKQTRAQKHRIAGQLDVVDRRQRKLLRVISAYNQRIDKLNGPIGELSGEIDSLETQVQNRRNRIEELRSLYRRQAKDLVRFALQRDEAQAQLASRLVEAYKRGDSGDAAWLVGAGSLSDAMHRRKAINRIVGVDADIVNGIAEIERKIRVRRAQNHDIRRRIASDIVGIRKDLESTDAKRAQLLTRRGELEAVKGQRDGALNQLEVQEEHLHDEFDQLSDNAAALREAIRTGATMFASNVPGGPSPGVIGWPVNGPVVSGFGPRWGRMHEGIDIAVPAGVPIHAAATGVVTHCGWMSGYGNMVIVQHAGNLSTGYAHQSRIGVSCGQFVTQGQVLGYVGCTGHCFGDHLHFETRISGSAVNPMNYL